MATFKERCEVSEKCIPESEFKNCLIKLHSEMLQKITDLEFHKENYSCSFCWGDIRKCDCGQAD